MFLKINNLFFNKSSLSVKIMSWFLILSLVPLIIFAIYSYKHNSAIVKKTISAELKHSSELQKRYIYNWFNFRKADVQNWAQSFDIQHMSNIYENYQYVHNIYKISKDGDILYTYKKNKFFGPNLFDDKYSKTKFAKTFRQTLKDKKTHFSDLEYYESSNGNIAGFMITPIFDKTGVLDSVFVVQIKLSNIFSLFEKKQNHKSYLVGVDGFLRTNISDDKLALNHKVDLNILKEGHIQDKEIFRTRENLNILGVNWILINEYNYDYIFENKRVFLETLLLFLLIITIIIYLVARYISLQITKPIDQLIKASKLISNGNYTSKIKIDLYNEIGHLANSFNKMTHKLSRSLQEIKDQKNSFEQLYQKSTDGILLLEGGKVKDCNEAIIKMLKYENKEMLLNTHPSKLSPTFQPDGQKSYEKANNMMDLALLNGAHMFERVNT
ncbi:MAG: HAMP domain-containing protein, partial [Sulfurimonas sp.]|nr:HAMP domain-containing protein [Sulfurimonas sp.]